MTVVSVVISLVALVVSLYVGLRQIKINQFQADLQNKVELYLQCGPATERIVNGNKQTETILPVITIRNISNNVIYLKHYLFNGKEYPLNQEVLPPSTSFEAFHYIYLPTDGTNHVSLDLFFYDWAQKLYMTKGYADIINGKWTITYAPCVRVN